MVQRFIGDHVLPKALYVDRCAQGVVIDRFLDEVAHEAKILQPFFGVGRWRRVLFTGL